MGTIYDKIRNAFVGTATPYYVSQGNFYLESNNIKDGQINRNSEIFINDEFYLQQKDNWLRTGDMVMVQSGHVGHAAVIPPELNNSAAHALIIFSNPKEIIDPYFLNYQYQTSSYKKEIDNIATGNTIRHILSSEMKKFTVLTTKIEEQNRISGFFIQLDNLITLHQRKLEMLKRLKQAYLQQMFPENNEKVPRIRFANFSRRWEQRKFSDMLEINSGKDYKHLHSGNIPVYGTGGYMLSVDDKLSNLDGIGIGRKGTIDKPQFLKAPFWTVDTLFYMIPYRNLDINFLFAMAQGINWKRMDESTGVPSLSKTTINNINKYFPVISEQQCVGLFLKQLDDILTLHQKKIDCLKKIKSIYLKSMFI